MARTRDSRAHEGHRGRMRQRVQNEGFEGLEPHEIIEFLLFYAIRRQDVNELAHQLIGRFGGVGDVLNAQPPDLQSVHGVGAQTARCLALIGEAANACAGLSSEDRPELRNCMDAFRYAARAERNMTFPCCIQLCLDMTGRLLYRRTICDSLSWGEPETMRQALGDVFTSQAYGVILLVCAGDRDIESQDYDAEHTVRYADTLRASDCVLLDIILVGAGTLSSMRRSGLIPESEETAYARSVREDYVRNMPEGRLRTQDFRDFT